MAFSQNEVQQELASLAASNDEYASFNSRIVNSKKAMLGVRVPALRKLAKKLARDCKFNDIKLYISELDPEVYEQVVLAGMLVVYAKLTDAEKIALARSYIELADSWAEIDLFAGKRRNFDEKLWWDFAVESLNSGHEFTVRYGIIEMMTNFLTDKYIENVFTRLRTVRHDGYYVRMGLAWLYATAAVKYFERTLREIQSKNLSTWTQKKALTKMLESYRFTPEQKAEIRRIRKELGS